MTTSVERLHIGLMKRHRGGASDEPLTKRTYASYDTNACIALFEPMAKYVEDHAVARAAADFVLTNKLTNECIGLAYSPAGNVAWKTAFEHTGHAYSLDAKNNYVVPLVLDIDCIQCKREVTNQTESHQPISRCAIGALSASLIDATKLWLNCSEATAVVQMRRGHCGFHIYIDASISLIAYDVLISHLQAEIDLQGVFILDRLECFPLPYSSKCDGEAYTGIAAPGVALVPSAYPSNIYYEMQGIQYLAHLPDPTVHVCIGTYELHERTHSRVAAQWLELLMRQTFLVRSKAQVHPVKVTVGQGPRLVRSGFTSATGNRGLEANLNVSRTVQENVQCIAQETLMQYKACTQPIKTMFEALAKIIASAAYNARPAASETLLRYFAMTLMHDESKYAFYMLGSTLALLHGHGACSVADTAQLLHVCAQAARDLGGVCPPKLVTCLAQTAAEWTACFGTGIEWFECICSVICDDHIDALATISSHTEAASIISSAVRYIKSKLIVFAEKTSCATVFRYRSAYGIYVSESHAKLTQTSEYKLLELQLTGIITAPSDGALKKLLSTIKYSFDSTIAVIQPAFNEYAYFLNTERGVFNTLTGTYMAHIPLLYFNTRNGPFIDPHRLGQIDVWSAHVGHYLSHQVTYFAHMILLPGLCNLRESLLTTATMDAIIQCLATLLDSWSTSSTQEALKDILTQVESMYACHEPECLHLMDQRISECMRQQHEITLENLKVTQIDGKDPPKSSRRLRLLAYIVCILDWASNAFEYTSSTTFVHNDATVPAEPPSATTVFGVGDPTLAHMMYSVSVWCNFDQVKVVDLLTNLAMYFAPASTRKMFILIIGPPRCGKSTLLKLLHHIAREAAFAPANALQPSSDSSAPAPDVKFLASRSIVTISEVRSISTAFIKSITGDDRTDQRGLYEGEPSPLKPHALVIGAANALPHVYDADEAIRTRAAPFQFHVAVQPEPLVDDINPLVLYASRAILEPPVKLNIERSSSEFLWLLYGAFVALRNDTGVLIPQINNSGSLELVHQLLVQNNVIYWALQRCGIVFEPHLQIGVSELRDLVKDALEAHKSNAKLNIPAKIQSLTCLFAGYLAPNEKTFIGIGRPNVVEAAIRLPLRGTVTLSELRQRLKRDNAHWTAQEIHQQLAQFRTQHRGHYNARTSSFSFS